MKLYDEYEAHDTNDLVREVVHTLILLVLLGIIVMGGCTIPPGPQPSPAPSTSPSPSPSPTSTPPPGQAITAPLMVKGTSFIDGATGKVFRMMGPEACCEDSKSGGWPGVNEQFIRLAKEHGANIVFMRLGPYTMEGEPKAPMFVGDKTLYSFEPYIRLKHPTPGYHSMYNPRDGFEPSYWPRQRRIVEIARDAGLMVMVDIADAWLMRNNRTQVIEGTVVQTICAWESCEPTIKLSPPRTWHARWTEEITKQLGRYPNVLFSIGNEAFLPKNQVGPKWEFGIRDIVRAQEKKYGYVRHLIGTNSMLPEIEKGVDFVIEHGPVAHAPRWNKPLVNTESSDKLDARAWGVEARRARRLGSAMMLWRGNMLEAEWQGALDDMQKIQEGQ